MELTNAKIDKEEQRRLEAKKVLDDLESCRPVKLAQLKERKKEVKELKKNHKEVLDGFKDVYNKLEMGESGGSHDTAELRNNKNVLRIDDEEASRGMKLTGRLEITPNEVAIAEANARRRGGRDLNTWGYEKTSENCRITQEYRHAMGAGLSEHIEKKKKNVLVDFPKMEKRYSRIIKIMDEGEGVEIHAPGDDVP